MIELWGADTCIACKQAVQLLSRTQVRWRYIDVSKTNFEGEIPRLILENGQEIIGLGRINTYVRKLMEKEVFKQ